MRAPMSGRYDLDGLHVPADDIAATRRKPGLSWLRAAPRKPAPRVLAPGAAPPLFLSWPDAAPHITESPAWRKTVARLIAFCASHCVDAIAVTGRDEPLAMSRRHLALAQHRSQMTPLDGKGFCVPSATRQMPAPDLLYTRYRA